LLFGFIENGGELFVRQGVICFDLMSTPFCHKAADLGTRFFLGVFKEWTTTSSVGVPATDVDHPGLAGQ
jgi:hypothetical protein